MRTSTGCFRGVVAPSLATRLALLLLLQLLWLVPSRSQDSAVPSFKDEIAKQNSIYQTRGKEVPAGYIVSRSLSSYAETLPSGFRSTLQSLGPNDRWLDIGAGRGQAILDYYASAEGQPAVRSRRKARAVAMSIEDRRNESWEQAAANLDNGQIRYVFSKPLRDYSRDELGRFQLITDVYGGFTYTDNLSRFVEKVLDLLEVNGSFFSLLQDVHLEDGRDRHYERTPYYLTEIIDANGKDVNVCSWLKSIACVKVTCESQAWASPTELVQVEKVCSEVSVPALAPLRYEAGTPPGRRFQLLPHEPRPAREAVVTPQG